jgi:ABC-type microcin C transport system duplicated ATPase subunit YejF
LRQKSSYLLISHDLEFLRSLTQRIIMLDRGQIVFDGDWWDADKCRNLLPSKEFGIT